MFSGILLFVGLLSGTNAAIPPLAFEAVHTSHDRFTPEREPRYRPLEKVYIRFRLRGLASSRPGVGSIHFGLKLTNAAGATCAQLTTDCTSAMPLGPCVPGCQGFEIPSNMPPGDYFLTGTARDNTTWRVASFNYKVTILPREFAVTPPIASFDAEGNQAAPYGGFVGQLLYFSYRVLGTDNSTGKPVVRGRFEMLDRRTGLVLNTSAMDVEDPGLPLPGGDIDATVKGTLFLQLAGDFIVRFTVTDTVAGKTASVEVPVQVRDP
jgi:hypothetical protein